MQPATVESLTPFSRAIYDSLKTEDEKRIFLERHPVYGDPMDSHANIGLVWTAILQQHYGIKLPEAIPPHIVALMMAGMKVQRSTRAFHKDNYDDLSVYAKFAEQFQQFIEKAIK